jgi:poly-gamma-glutamate synthase PgsB/CapB
MLVITIILFLIIGVLICEKWIIQRNVRSIQLRIHVNGTRGKSSVTEYIAAGLFNSHSEVMAKITGIVPTIIHNGKEQIIKRSGVARVQEQMNLMRFAARKNANSLVLECMSISPELQRLESYLFQPHIYVITNIKDDHREDLGKNIEEQATHICNAIPGNCKVITKETRFLNIIIEKAAGNNSTVLSPPELDNDLSERLPHGVFPENVSLALAVCGAAGINHKQAEEGIMSWILNKKSPLTTINYGNKEVRFLNAFAVNDIESTDSFLNHWKKKLGYNGKISVIFNTRADRPLRTDLFAGWLTEISSSVEKIIVTGNHANRAKSSILKAGADKRKVHAWRRKHLRDLRKNLFEAVNEGSLVIGIGNIGGEGLNILKEIS